MPETPPPAGIPRSQHLCDGRFQAERKVRCAKGPIALSNLTRGQEVSSCPSDAITGDALVTQPRRLPP